jgi:hypothetical protein
MQLPQLPRILCACLFAVALAGCAHNQGIKAQGAAISWSQTAEKRIAVIHPDVHLGELTASGLVEARADWTKAAEQGIAKNLKSYFAAQGVGAVMVDEISDPHEIQLAKLHGPVGRAVIIHALLGVKLPNKTAAMDWTLGPGAAVLRDHYGADYALFMYVNDSYTSAGRALLMLGAAAFGVGIQGGQQVAFVSLVDLRSGNILWFNVRSDGGGDLRDDKGAKSFVKGILSEMPK